jgi:hypothetical protein
MDGKENRNSEGKTFKEVLAEVIEKNRMKELFDIALAEHNKKDHMKPEFNCFIPKDYVMDEDIMHMYTPNIQRLKPIPQSSFVPDDLGERGRTNLSDVEDFFISITRPRAVVEGCSMSFKVAKERPSGKIDTIFLVRPSLIPEE